MMLVAACIVAAVVYLITGNAIVAYLLPYFSALWPNLRTAFWLRLNDPWRARGKACFWFYLATAGWQAAAYGLILITSVMFLAQAGVKFNNMKPPVQELLSVPIGLAIAAIIGWVGIIAAIPNRTKVFIIPRLYDRCHGDFQNVFEVADSYRGRNTLMFVVVSLVFLPILILGAGLSVSFPIVGLPILGLGPLCLLPLYSFFSNRIIARAPIECWPLGIVGSTAAPLQIERLKSSDRI
jgi:hypothetical protein